MHVIGKIKNNIDQFKKKKSSGNHGQQLSSFFYRYTLYTLVFKRKVANYLAYEHTKCLVQKYWFCIHLKNTV